MADERVPLPPGLDLLWGRRERGKRGPRPGLSADAIVETAMRIADAEGLEAISMARVASELGFTTMSLYRYVANKDELLQLMWNASARGAEKLVITGDGWRDKLRQWSVIQREMLDRHPWVTQMPMAAPPLGPNSLHFVERGLEALAETPLSDAHKMRLIGLLSSYTLSEARLANDAARAAAQARAARAAEAGGGSPPELAPAVPPPDFQVLLRELVDERTYPQLYRLAWSADDELSADDQAEFLFGIDTILDGVQAFIDRG